MKILFIGDVVGQPGRNTVTRLLPEIKEQMSPVFVIANGENAAGGFGITEETAFYLYQAGVDVITLGNHVWSKKEVYPYLDNEPNILRPANYPDGVPGRGWAIYEGPAGESIGVISLCGRVYMEPLENPFKVADSILEYMAPNTDAVFIDLHAEATSEKNAFGQYVDGRASAVVGTHTHIQTADERILSNGTAYITDVGMTGPINSVIGVKSDIIIRKFLTQLPARFEIADGETIFSAVAVDIDSASGKAEKIERIAIRHNNTHRQVR